ncbi:MAG: hypothetical protein JWL92_462 [Candidatus Nomurabacteria bacterium]|nr:hypothetical protein [Candidatus Nomurabacteria bacterium]
MGTSTPKRLAHLKKLVKIYVGLERGSLINKHLELLRICTIQNSVHPEHPHDMVRVYISRKALKHFVESRSYELRIRHTSEQIIENICFALDSIQETITNFDRYELERPEAKHFYTKDYSVLGRPQLRIVLEYTDDKLEIVSIHFRERKGK